ncbi:hypothetical protein BV22DRAFT_745430 [Leucogyrophana mollusca]|uniref:Uncharacterized protein n=1 Tax=Leucogyrophana mollusca TaxID=85980 RepID=A0ACB8B6N5_9AGAM|nr:hypothetical protein BV22DRAFT_745430 [Leucogyrophana mollusca]
MLFSGTACFSRRVPKVLVNEWGAHGGTVAEPHKRASAKFFFAVFPEEEWVTTLLSRSVVVFHAGWIAHCVAQNFRVPIAGYVLDEHFSQDTHFKIIEASIPKSAPVASLSVHNPTLASFDPPGTNPTPPSTPPTSASPNYLLKRKRSSYEGESGSSDAYHNIPRRPKKRRVLRFSPSFSPTKHAKISNLGLAASHPGGALMLPNPMNAANAEDKGTSGTVGPVFSVTCSPARSGVSPAPQVDQCIGNMPVFRSLAPDASHPPPAPDGAHSGNSASGNTFSKPNPAQAPFFNSTAQLPPPSPNGAHFRFPALAPVQVRFLHRFTPQPPLTPNGVHLLGQGFNVIHCLSDAGSPTATRADAAPFIEEPNKFMAAENTANETEAFTEKPNTTHFHALPPAHPSDTSPARLPETKHATRSTPKLDFVDFLEVANLKKAPVSQRVRFQCRDRNDVGTGLEPSDDSRVSNIQQPRPETRRHPVEGEADTVHFLIEDILRCRRRPPQRSLKANGKPAEVQDAKMTTDADDGSSPRVALFMPGSTYHDRQFSYSEGRRKGV